jgi:uncharacterized OB-fold protein
MAVTRADFPLPDVADPLTAEHFAGAARGELMIPRCEKCGSYVWYPAPECPTCAADAISWIAVSGDATLFSWAVVRRAFLPAFETMVPFVSAIVALAEDANVRLCTYVVDAKPEILAADMALRVTFRPLSFPTVADRAVVVPMFMLSNGGGA